MVQAAPGARAGLVTGVGLPSVKGVGHAGHAALVSCRSTSRYALPKAVPISGKPSPSKSSTLGAPPLLPAPRSIERRSVPVSPFSTSRKPLAMTTTSALASSGFSGPGAPPSSAPSTSAIAQNPSRRVEGSAVAPFTVCPSHTTSSLPVQKLSVAPTAQSARLVTPGGGVGSRYAVVPATISGRESPAMLATQGTGPCPFSPLGSVPPVKRSTMTSLLLASLPSAKTLLPTMISAKPGCRRWRWWGPGSRSSRPTACWRCG